MKKLAKTFVNELGVKAASSLLGLDEARLRAPGGTTQESLGTLLAEKAAQLGEVAVRKIVAGAKAKLAEPVPESEPEERREMLSPLRGTIEEEPRSEGILSGIMGR